MIAFLKRFTVVNVDQCEELPDELTSVPALPDPILAVAEADRVIAATGADFRIGGSEAFYSPSHDYVQVPSQAAFHDPVNWYRTAPHELGHHSGHVSRLNRSVGRIWIGRLCQGRARRGNGSGLHVRLARHPTHGAAFRLYRGMARVMLISP